MALILIDSNISGGVSTFSLPFVSDGSTAICQSFTGTGIALNWCQFKFGKFGSPTGNLYAKLYLEAHATAFGTDSLPTGSVLATSDPIDVSSIPVTVRTARFNFPSPATLDNGTKYCIVLEFVGTGDINNYISGIVLTGDTHSGNAAKLVGGTTWTVYPYAYDCLFSCFNGTDLTVEIGAIGTPVAAGTGAITPTIPAGTAVGDLMVAIAYARTNSLTFTCSAGWDERYDPGGQTTGSWAVYTRVYVASDGNPTITPSANESIVGVIFSLYNADITTIFDVAIAGSAFAAPGDSKVTIAAFNTITDGALAFFCAGSVDDNEYTKDSGSATLLVSLDTTAGTDAALGIMGLSVPSAGTTGDQVFLQSAKGGDAGRRLWFAIKPVASGNSYSESVSFGSSSGISDGRITGMAPVASLPGAAAISENALWTGARPVSLPGQAALAAVGKKDGFGAAALAVQAALIPAGGLSFVNDTAFPVLVAITEAADLAVLKELGLVCQAGISLGAVLSIQSAMSLSGSAVLGEGSGGSSLFPGLSIPASGVISGIGIVEVARNLGLASIADLPAAARANLIASKSFPASAGLDLAAALLAERALILSGLGALTSDGEVEAGTNQYQEAVSLAAVAAAVKTALLSLSASQSLDGAGGITAAAIIQATAETLLSTTGALTADHILVRLGAVQFDSAAGMSLGTLMQAINNVLLTGSTGLTPAALNAALRLISLAVTADLTASGGFDGSQEIFLAAAAALASTLIYEMGAPLGLACLSSLTLQSSFTGGNLISLAATGQMQELAEIVLSQVLAMAGAAGQMAAAAKGQSSAFLLPATGGLAVAAELGIMQTCSLAGVTSLTVVRQLGCAGLLMMESVSAFTPFFGPRVVRGYRLDLIINALKLDLKLD